MTDNTNASELLPCPFCGGEAGVMQQSKVNWAVMCHVCGAEGGWGNATDAIEQWNRRAAPQPQGGALLEAFDTAYMKAAQTSQPSDWHEAALMARQWRNSVLSAPSAPQQGGDGLRDEQIFDMADRFARNTFWEEEELKEVTFTPQGLTRFARAAILAAPRQPATFDAEALIRACVPGGSICDPQQVADAIRAYAAPRQPGEMGAGVQPTCSVFDDMLRSLEHVECVYRLNVVKDGEPSSTLDNLQRVIARAKAASAQQDEREALGESNRLQFLMNRYPGTVEFKRSTVLAIMRQFGEALLAQQVQADAGAVPFGYAQPSGGNYFTRTKRIADRIGGLVPIYTHPAGESDKRDTERYQWMIEHVHTHRLWERKEAWFCLPNNATEGRGYSTASAAIDAAMSREQSGGGEA